VCFRSAIVCLVFSLPNTLSEIPFSMVNKTYVYGLQDIVLGNVVKDGMFDGRGGGCCR
jgi:hypothetical protein